MFYLYCDPLHLLHQLAKEIFAQTTLLPFYNRKNNSLTLGTYLLRSKCIADTLKWNFQKILSVSLVRSFAAGGPSASKRDPFPFEGISPRFLGTFYSLNSCVRLSSQSTMFITVSRQAVLLFR